MGVFVMLLFFDGQFLPYEVGAVLLIIAVVYLVYRFR